ncbi:MAG: hypothetical protein P1V18_00515 [Candidatus Gracilibacteria bacterium]|nr:hypothetical protein [Candidatus Gracilibacteria bacterium]
MNTKNSFSIIHHHVLAAVVTLPLWGILFQYLADGKIVCVLRNCLSPTVQAHPKSALSFPIAALLYYAIFSIIKKMDLNVANFIIRRGLLILFWGMILTVLLFVFLLYIFIY